MPLERFIPKSPDPFIRNSQDFEVAKFGHLNTIIEYVNTYVVTDSLQLSGTGPLTSTARYITDSLGNASSLAISTGNIGIGTTNATARLRVISADTNGIVDLFQLDSSAAPLHLTRYGGNVPINLNTSGGTSTSPTPLGNGTAMSRISTNTYNGTAFGTSARIEVVSKGIQSATNYGSNMRFFVTAENAISTSEVLTILSSGNVQINESFVTDRNAKLFIKGSGSTSATTSLLVQNSGGVDLIRVQDNSDLTIGTFASGLGKIVINCDPAYGIKTILANNFGAPIIRQVSTDVLYFGGQQIASILAIGYLSFNAPRIYGNTILGNSTGSSFNFFVTISPYAQTPSTASRGVLFNGNVDFQSGGYANYFELSPTYSFDSSNGRIIRGIYYNPTLVTPNTNDKHYGIQTTSGGAYINTATPNASAALQADSTTQGFLPPRMTTAQRTAIVSPAAGLIVYDTDTNKSYTYDGTAWQAHW